MVSRALVRPWSLWEAAGRQTALGVWLRVEMFQSDSSCLRDISSFTATQLSAMHMCS